MRESPTVTPNRWLITVAATIVMLCLGVVYSWSIFTTPLIAIFHWSNTVTTSTFALAIFFLGWGAVVGGRWQDKVGPRVVTVVGILLWGLGNLLAGWGTTRFGAPWLYATYGILGGFGNGMAYITPVAVATKWFPDRRGFGTGMVVMGFGLGAFFYNQVIPRIDAFARAAQHASAYAAARTAAIKAGTAFDPAQHPMASADVATVMHVFLGTGLFIAVVGGLCAAVMRDPPAAVTTVARRTVDSAARSFAPREVLHMHQFYFLWLMLFLNTTAGILVISNAVPIYSELTGAAIGIAAQIYGLLAIFNGLGRFFWGAVSDRLGRNLAFALLFAIQAFLFLVMGHLHSMALVGLCFAIVLLCYGGGFGTMPSFNADYFGTRYVGMNYGMILTAWGFAGIVGPLIGSFIRDRTGTFTGALLPVAILLLAAMILPLTTHKPRERLGQATPAPT